MTRDSEPTKTGKGLTYPELHAKLAAIHTRAAQKPADFVKGNERTRIARAISKPPSTAKLITGLDALYGFDRLTEIDTRFQQEQGTPTVEAAIDNLYLTTLRTIKKIDQVEIDTLGRKQGPSHVNMLGDLFTERMGWYVGLKYAQEFQANPALLAKLDSFSTALSEDQAQGARWYASNSMIFTTSIRHALLFRLQLHNIEISSGEETAALQEANNQLADRIQALRQYGVKPAIVPSSSATPINQWLITDAISEREAISATPSGPSKAFMPDYLASFIGTTGKFRSSRLQIQHQGEAGDVFQMTFFDVNSVLEPRSTAALIGAIAQDGTLLTGKAMPIKPLLEHFGIDAKGYEIIRADLLSVLADLVTPATIADAIYRQEQQMSTGGGFLSKKQRPSLRDLVLARVKIIDERHNEIIEILEGAHDSIPIEPEPTGQEGIHQREIARHDVVGHLRRLAAHQRATSEAREKALKETGIVLPEYGATYVKRHSRGTAEDTSLGHQATRRRPSDPRRN